jgi:hypothetical protein
MQSSVPELSVRFVGHIHIPLYVCPHLLNLSEFFKGTGVSVKNNDYLEGVLSATLSFRTRYAGPEWFGYESLCKEFSLGGPSITDLLSLSWVPVIPA